MVQITISDELKNQLLAAGGEVQLCDSTGAHVANATPRRDAIPPGWVCLTPELSEEEYQRRLNSTDPGISGEELLARLRSKL